MIQVGTFKDGSERIQSCSREAAVTPIQGRSSGCGWIRATLRGAAWVSVGCVCVCDPALQHLLMGMVLIGAPQGPGRPDGLYQT